MQKPTVCIVFDAIGKQSAISKIAMHTVQIALEAGWQVTVVAKWLDASLQGEVEWIPLFRPKRVFLYQWLVARTAIKKAIGDRKFDVVHVWQPQVAAIADVINCQFLTRAAFERDSFATQSSLRSFLGKMQLYGVAYAEDYYWRHWNPKTRMIYCSELVQQDFHRLYGKLPREEVIVNACPPISVPTAEERSEARRALLGKTSDKIILGYLGGVDERKGYRSIVTALDGQDDLFFLMGGRGSDKFAAPSLEGRYRGVGLLKHDQLATFYATCDVVVVPSLFDPCPLVVFEAASRGVPVIATEGVGNLPNLLEYKAGSEWRAGTALAPIVRDVNKRRDAFSLNCQRMAGDLSEDRYARQILSIYDKVLQEKRPRPQTST